MKIFYTNFSYWRKLSVTDKSNFTFLATSRTVPKDYTGLQFEEFTPSWNLFKEACEHFDQCNFDVRYKKQIYSLDKTEILKKLSKYNTDIVFLVWESENKGSERDIFIPWITGCLVQDIKNFSLELELEYRKNSKNFLFNI